MSVKWAELMRVGWSAGSGVHVRWPVSERLPGTAHKCPAGGPGPHRCDLQHRLLWSKGEPFAPLYGGGPTSAELIPSELLFGVVVLLCDLSFKTPSSTPLN